MARIARTAWLPALLALPLTLAAAPLPPPVGSLAPDAVLLVEVVSEGTPVEGAEVRAEPVQTAPPRAAVSLTATTDGQGRARLQLPAGDHLLRVTRLGFQAETRQVTLAHDEEVGLRIELTPQVLEAEGLVVTSTRTGRRVQDEPLRIEVLDREEIEEKVLMAPGHIAMLLAETGGVRVQTTSPSLGSANVRIHGMRGRYTQLLADGLPLYGGQAGSIGLLQIPPADLGQVEVIKGAASALYGGSALGGVVNLISRRPGDDPTSELLLNGTHRGGQDLVGYHDAWLNETLGYSLLGGLHRQTPRDVDGGGWIDIPGHRRAVIRPRLFWSGPAGASGYLTAGFMTEAREGGTASGALLPDGTPFPETLDTRRTDVGYTLRLPVGEALATEVRGSIMEQRHDHGFGGREEGDRHRTAFVETTLAGARHSGTLSHWVLGLALQGDRYRSESYPDFDYDFTVPAVFAQADVEPGEGLTVSGSLRWDVHSEYGDQLSPRISALYRTGPWNVRSSAGGGFFAPTPFVEEIEAVGLRRLAPLGELEAERAWNASLDVGRFVGPLEVNAILFASRIRDAVQLVPVRGEGSEESAAGLRGVQVANVAGLTRFAGSELLARYRQGDISVTGSWTQLRATEPVPGEAGRRTVPLTPRHTVGLVAMWEDHDRGLLGIESYITGRQELDDNPFRTASRRQVDLGILGEVRRGPLRVFVNLENLLDMRQGRWDPIVRPHPTRSGQWTVDAWAPLEGRVLSAGIRIVLGGDGHHHHPDDHHDHGDLSTRSPGSSSATYRSPASQATSGGSGGGGSRAPWVMGHRPPQ